MPSTPWETIRGFAAKLTASMPRSPVAATPEGLHAIAAPAPGVMHAILYALPDPALVLDDAATLIHGNSRAREVFGDLRLDEHISRTTRNPALAAAISAAGQSGRREPFELIVRRPIERHLEGAATRLAHTIGGSRMPAVLVVLRDISERDALARMRMEFVANASHELRTPLAALAGFIETLSGPPGTIPRPAPVFSASWPSRPAA